MGNVDVMKGGYDAFGRGDIEAVLAIFDPEIQWREAEGNPYEPAGTPWVGGQEVTDKLFIKLATEWDGFTVTPEQFHDAGDTVVVQGRYTGTYKATGTSIDAQLCHVWKLRNGKVTSFQQYVDTAQLQDVMGVRSDPEPLPAPTPA
jgi:uncharacterized protein